MNKPQFLMFWAVVLSVVRVQAEGPAVSTKEIVARYQAIEQQAGSMKKVVFKEGLYKTPVQGEARIDKKGRVRKVFRVIPVKVPNGQWEERSVVYFDEAEQPVWASEKASASNPAPYDRETLFANGQAVEIHENGAVFTPDSEDWITRSIETKAGIAAALQTAQDALK